MDRRSLAWTAVRSLAGAVVLVAAYYLVPLRQETGMATILRLAGVVLAVGGVLTWQIRQILAADEPRLRAIEALAVTVTTMVVVFALVYEGLSHRSVGAFSEPLERTAALYFTLTTLATVGYGDIYARTDGARIAVMVQMVFNVAVIGASVRLIVGAARRTAVRRGDRPWVPYPSERDH